MTAVLLSTPLVILHYLLNVSVQLANKRGFKQKQKQKISHRLLNVSVQLANKRGLKKKLHRAGS
jgi:hypothetical protein